MELQPKLLRIIQEGSFERVGSERTISVNVRIVAATHVDLAEAARILEERKWPGNVRELRNALERAAILTRGSLITEAHIAIPPPQDQPDPNQTSSDRANPSGMTPETGTTSVTIDEAQRAAISVALKQSGGRIYGIGGAVELLGLKASTLQSRMKKLGMETRR